MELPQDFRELLELFNAHHVDYVIVGAFALSHHGAPRYTGDLDILLHADIGNAERVIAALTEFGFGSLGIKPEDLSKPDIVVQLGVPPVRVDLLTSITGVSWDAIAAGREPGSFGGVDVYYIGRSQFVLNKRAIGRPKDMADLHAIGEI